MQSFQLQRVARLAQRMHNFGYDRPTMELVCRTLFLTQLHNKDLWQLWRFFSKGQTEVPLTLGQTRHLLSLLSEGESAEHLEQLVQRVDKDGSGTVEFDEFAVPQHGQSAVLVVPRRTTLAAWGWLSLQAPRAAPRSPGRAGEPLTQGPTGGCGVAVGLGRSLRRCQHSPRRSLS